MRNKTQKYFLRKILAIFVLFIASFFVIDYNNNVSAITIDGLDYVAPEYDRLLGGYNAFDVRGRINGSANYNFKTTYAYAGYSIDYTVDGTNTTWRNVTNGATLTNQNVEMTLATTQTASGVDVKLTMANPEDNGDKAYKVAITSDVQIGSNDYAAIYKNGYAGLVATQDDTRYPSDYGAQIFIDFSPEVQTLWIGPYNNRRENKFNSSTVSKYTAADHVDTGAAWSWQGTIAAGENKELITSFNLVETESSTIRFYGADGRLIKEEEALVGGAINLPALSEADDGYRHVWNTARDGSGTSYNGGESIIVESEEIDFYEVMLPNRYSISYDLNGGRLPEGAQKEYTVEDDFVLAEPVREGYTFAGWTGANGSTPEKTVRVSGGLGNKSYTANWEVNQYTLTFDTNGGSEVGEIRQDYGAVVTLPTTSRFGYTFAGWYVEGVCVGLNGEITIPATDIEITAAWEEAPESEIVEEIVERVTEVLTASASSEGFTGGRSDDTEGVVGRIAESVTTAASEARSTAAAPSARVSATGEASRGLTENSGTSEEEEPEAIAPLGVVGRSSGASGKKGIVDAVVEYLRWVFCWVLGGLFFWFIILPFRRRKDEEEEEEEK